LNKGVLVGSGGLTPSGGHTQPISTVGDKQE